MPDDPSRYPIGAVSKLTGITVDTLRIWERRYGVVSPHRDERGRMYSEADVRRLQLLAAAVSRGHSIGRLAKRSDEEIQNLLSARPVTLPASGGHASSPGPAVIEGLLAALHAYDAVALDRELGRLALALPPRELVYRVVLPVMQVVGDEWHAGRLSAGQEHLLSAALRSLLGSMARLSASDRAARRLLFATPAGERHEFGILGAALLAAISGFGVIYLGPDLPAAQILDVATRTGVQVVVLGVVHSNGSAESMDAVHTIAEELPPPVELWLGGPFPAGAEGLPARPGLVVLPDFSLFEAHLARLNGAGSRGT